MSTTFTNPRQPQKVLMTGGTLYAWANGAEGADAPKVSYSFNGTRVRFYGWWGVPELARTRGAVGLVVDAADETAFNTPTSTAANVDAVLLAEASFENGPHDVELFVRSGIVSLSHVWVDINVPGVS
jgi:hypothetical protein